MEDRLLAIAISAMAKQLDLENSMREMYFKENEMLKKQIAELEYELAKMKLEVK